MRGRDRMMDLQNVISYFFQIPSVEKKKGIEVSAKREQRNGAKLASHERPREKMKSVEWAKRK